MYRQVGHNVITDDIRVVEADTITLPQLYKVLLQLREIDW